MRITPRRPLARELPSAIVCRSCCPQRRQLASASAPPAPPTSGLACLSSRRLISVVGPDAAKFLQGIITANISRPDGNPRTDGFYAAFLTATGRILHDVFVYPNHGPDEPGFLVEVDADQAPTLARHIKRYKLRAKLAVKLLAEDEASVWHAWDDNNAADWDSIVASTRLSLKDPRVPGLGYRFARLDRKTPEVDVELATEDSYTIRRYLQGVAEGQDEMAREHSLPQESNIDVMNGIDWRKGCYVGQELTIRTRHRGVVRKRVLPCVLYDRDQAAPATLAYHADSPLLESVAGHMVPQGTGIGRFEKRGRSAGKWLKGVGNVGLGLCRLEIMTDVTLPGEAATGAAWTGEDEFVLEWGEKDEDEGETGKMGVKVKAFVPEWLRKGLEEQTIKKH